MQDELYAKVIAVPSPSAGIVRTLHVRGELRVVIGPSAEEGQIGMRSAAISQALHERHDSWLPPRQDGTWHPA
jgi:hypothetical protein